GTGSERAGGEGLEVHAVGPETVGPEQETRHAPHACRRIGRQVAGDHLDEGHRAAAEEQRVAVVLEDVDPSVEALEMVRESRPVGEVRRAPGVVDRVRVAALPGRELRPYPWPRSGPR